MKVRTTHHQEDGMEPETDETTTDETQDDTNADAPTATPEEAAAFQEPNVAPQPDPQPEPAKLGDADPVNVAAVRDALHQAADDATGRVSEHGQLLSSSVTTHADGSLMLSIHVRPN